MAIYPCGDDTGVYYLIVSGLPWSATWQKLKDFVRYPENGGVIDVEHVFIYPSTTDAWVKIRGKEDFQKAYGEMLCFTWKLQRLIFILDYLNGRVFQGKAIVADDRNGHGIVNLRDMAPILTVSRRERSTNSSPETYYLQHAHGSQTLSPPQYAQHNYADSYALYPPSSHSSDVCPPGSPQPQR